jgi:nucleotide-binding universal stress UspA family protein
MFGTICVGFDGSAPSENAIKTACGLARTFGADVHIVHTPRVESVGYVMGGIGGFYETPPMPSEAELIEAAEVMLKKATEVAEVAGVDGVTTHIGTGEPGEALVQAANDCGADLIVTGRRGLGNLRSLVLGSTSQTVSHLAECAHLTVK